ncbi:MAG TPA: hypothetical protein VGE39_12505 [Prosthecobacter sp.]
MADLTGAQHTGRWAHRKLALAAGIAVLPLGPLLWLKLRPSSQSLIFWLCWGTFALGLAWALLALFLPQGRLLKMQRWITGNALVFAGMLAAAEGICRIAKVDFNQLTGASGDPREGYPLCLRLPDRPLGDIYFTRAGPLTWTGKPLSSFLRIKHGTDAAYADEKEFTAYYDADGFRNPPEQKDWQAVVVGDSFTECGALPFEDAFTTRAAAVSGLRIRNLGVCNTGTLSHLEYLRHFGKSPSCTDAVLAFYDGNDVLDTELELQDLARHRETGWRPSRVPEPQHSLLKTAYQVAKHVASPPQAFRYQNAWLTAGGRETPITIRQSPMPLDPETMTNAQEKLLEDRVREWADTCRQMGLRPWLLYIPANNRTYHGLVKFDTNADEASRQWQPGSLPEHLKQLCENHGIRFADACPVLRQAAEKGTLVYNPILDTHLNAEGARLVGELLAKELGSAKTGSQETTRP